MVRPIEISDALSKSETAQRLLQSQKVQPEAAQQFQKDLTSRTAEQVTKPNPVPKGDEVVLRVSEEEEEKRKTTDGEEYTPREETGEEKSEKENDGSEEGPLPHDHIDIKA